MSDVVDRVAPGVGVSLDGMLAVWQRVLQRQDIHPDDNFFDLGGDSLLSIQLFAELERVTGRKLPITAIYDAGTPREQVAMLDVATDRPRFSPLVLLNDVPGGPPIFLIHGIGGNVMELTRLGKIIDPKRRVFAIQARGLDGLEPAIETVEEMAEYYLAAVRGEQATGPYVLVGYSFGGIVALEMARRIQAMGETLAFLGFIDAYPHPRHWPMLPWLDVRWRRAAHKARSTALGKLGELIGRLRGATAGNGRRGPTALARPFMFDEDWPEAVRRVYDISLAALARYRPMGFGGSVVFFRAASRSFYLPNSPKMMWQRLLGGLDVVTVPGDHVDMIGRNAEALGSEIAKHVNAGLGRAGSIGRV